MPRKTSPVQTDSQTDQSNPANANNIAPSSSAQRTGSKLILYIIVAAVAVVVLVGLYLLIQSLEGPATQTPLGSMNGTPVYMGYDQGRALLGAISNYTTSDLFNPNSTLNITIIESLTNEAADNVTEGWGTFIQGQNATRNASIEFYVMRTYNAPEIFGSIASSLSQSFSTPPQTEYGTAHGLNYTYERYENGTTNFQAIVGWKDNYTVLTLLTSDPAFYVNQSTLIDATVNDTP